MSNPAEADSRKRVEVCVGPQSAPSDARREHNLLIPYAQLPEIEKKKDRGTRDWPKLLRRVKHDVVLPTNNVGPR